MKVIDACIEQGSIIIDTEELQNRDIKLLIQTLDKSHFNLPRTFFPVRQHLVVTDYITEKSVIKFDFRSNIKTLCLDENVYCIEFFFLIENEQFSINIKNVESFNNTDYYESIRGRNTFTLKLKKEPCSYTCTNIKQVDNKLLLYITSKDEDDFKLNRGIACARYVVNSSISCPIIFGDVRKIDDNQYIIFFEMNKNKMFDKDTTLDFKVGVGWIDYPNSEFATYISYSGKGVVVEDVFEDCKTQFYSTMHKTLALLIQSSKEEVFVRREAENSKISIAVIGSCYSRNAFGRQYNSDWSEKYEVVYDYFWSSLISMMSEPVSIINEMEFRNVAEEKYIKSIRRELRKTFFREIPIDVEYVIIDFFADAVHGVRRFEDGTYVGQGLAFVSSGKDYEQYERLVQRNTEKFDLRNAGYWDVWKESCDRFCEEIQKHGLDKKIILSKGSFSTWFKKGKEIDNYASKEFDGSKINKNFLDGCLGIWDRMNEYFMNKFPDTKIIDMDKYNYYAAGDGSGLPGPQHFEKNYYKSYLAELGTVILFDKISKKV